ncbi:MAG: P-type conjugative transfer ATPase TrbB [Chloroflexota bacterium]|nr:P-type conjugative transfer ATPase TrbB [Chloroflexota bacterium]
MTEEGRPSTRDEQARRLAESMKRQLGPSLCGILAERGLVELMLNADGQVWADRLGKGMAPVGTLASTAAETFIGTVASTLRGTVTRENPILECTLPGEPPFSGARFEAMIPPVVSAPVFTIRLKASSVFTLADYERQEIMSAAQRTAIERAIRERRNILVVGGTGTGKTTLTNAIIAGMVEAAPEHRLVIIEDTGELQCSARNAVVLLATDTVDMQRLLKATMRLRPDRIIVGEVRDGAALSLLKAWNTGHPGGASTIHANDAEAGLVRLEQLVAEASQAPMQPVIAEAVDLIVSIAKADNEAGRVIREIVSVRGFAGGSYQLDRME